MAPKIRADRDATKNAKTAAKARADAHFTGKKPDEAAADIAAKAETETLKTTIAQLNLPAHRDFEHHFKTCKGLKAKVDEINGKLRNAYKQADEAGVDGAWIKAAMKWQNRDEHEFRRFLGGLQRITQVAGINVQFQLLDETNLNTDEKAFQDGHRAGMAGQGYSDNPHALGAPSFQRWEDGRARGQQELGGQGIGKTEAETAEGDDDKKPGFFDELDNPAKGAASVHSPAADAASSKGIGGAAAH